MANQFLNRAEGHSTADVKAAVIQSLDFVVFYYPHIRPVIAVPNGQCVAALGWKDSTSCRLRKKEAHSSFNHQNAGIDWLIRINATTTAMSHLNYCE